jgi:hypothetical protein
MTATPDHIAHLIQSVNKDFVLGEDGFQVYWPTRSTGALSPWMLRAIADYLDEVNKPWSEEINAYFAAENQQEGAL